MDFTISDNTEKKRFEANIDGKTAFIEYKRDKNKLIILHTEVPEKLGGKGIGSGMVKQVLKKVAEEGLKVESRCPFVTSYIERHPEYQHLLA